MNTNTRMSLVTNRRALVGGGAALAGALVVPAVSRATRQATPATGASPDEILAIVRQAMDDLSLRSTILRIAIDGEELMTEALGESMTGVPVTTDLRFRNGAVAISLISTLMLTLVDEGLIGLDDPIAPYLPDLPESDKATFRMLSNMTAGYRDHVRNPEFVEVLMDDPFRGFTPDEILSYGLSQPRLFEPGTNWEYSHNNYFILGLAMEAATGQSVEQMMQERVLDPLGLTTTVNSYHAEGSRAGLACVLVRAPGVAGNRSRQALLRGIDLLESIVDDHPGRRPNLRHRRFRQRDDRRWRGHAAQSRIERGPARSRPAGVRL